MASTKRSRKRSGADNNVEETDWESKGFSIINNCSSPAELHSIMKHLSNLQESAQSKLLSVTSSLEDLVIMIDSNLSQDQDVSWNMSSHHITAQFQIGPKRHNFSMDIENVDAEGDERITVCSDLFTYEEEHETPTFDAPTLKQLKQFISSSGLENYRSPKSTDNDPSSLKSLQCTFADIVSQMVHLLIEKYGEEDDCGVPLGFREKQIYELLGIEIDDEEKDDDE